MLEGDRTLEKASVGRGGTARAALRHPTFRRVYFGSLASNVGSWMQNVVLGAFAFALTGSPFFVSLVTFAQLGPLLLLSLVGGTLADIVDRRRMIIAVAIEQGLLSLVLAVVVAAPEPSEIAILAVVFFIGVGQALYAPAFSSVMPTLVDREDLPGAVSLQSANMNASRVVGPAIGSLLYASVGASWVFVVNAGTYLAIIWAVWFVRFPPVSKAGRGQGDPTGFARLIGGFTVARHSRPIGRSLLTMALFSFFCLPFVAQMPTIATENLGLDPKSTTYGLLYAVFGLGALAGALSIGTVLAGRPLERVARFGMAGFSVMLAAFALVRAPAPAFPIILLLGFTYFATVTSLSSIVQQKVDDATRGRVMALWIMAFGGTVPLGALAFGPLIEATSMTAVMLVGVVVSAFLVWFVDVRDRDAASPEAGIA